jgi:enterochelin esterase family protein
MLLLLAERAGAGELRRGLALASPVLERVIPYALYLPEGFEPAGRFPVLFLLHGLGGREDDWTLAGRLEPTLDRLIAERAVPPMVVVMPGLGDGWYVDNPDPGGLGALETAFVQDLMPGIERSLGTGTRAIAGLSMGGWGALRLAMLHPVRFVAVAGLSAALVTEAEAQTSAWEGYFTGAFGRPFDLERFRAASPFTLIGGFARALKRPALFLTCGDDDELDLEEGNLLFYRALKHAGIGAELRITDGGHDWGLWSRELESVLRFVGERFRES